MKNENLKMENDSVKLKMSKKQEKAKNFTF
jgi:hypothetical protein